MKKVGTLKELYLKPGDVVEFYCGYLGMYPDYIGKQMVANDRGGVSFDQNNGFDREVDHVFRIVSRASDKPKLWRDMTDAEKGALLLAYHEGKVIEGRSEPWPSDEWIEIQVPAWCDDSAYRVRHEPKVETVTIHNWEVVTDILKGHRIIFNTIDGKPDCASIKMEPLE